MVEARLQLPPPPPSPTYPTLASGAGTLSTTKAVVSYEFRGANDGISTFAVSKTDLEISYDSATQSYTLRAKLDPRLVRPDTTSVAPADIRLSTLTYSGLGRWRAGTPRSDGGRTYADVYFSYGIQTLSSDLPKSGTGTYSLGIAGDSGAFPIGGTGTITANFGAATVAVELSPTFIYGPNRISHLDALLGSGPITASGFAASLTGGNSTGEVNGLFYGPQASEVGGVFTFSSPALSGGQVFVSGFWGRRD